MKHLYKFLGLLLVWFIAAGANAQTITNITNTTYAEHAPAITIHPNFTVTGGSGFGGGYMLFDLTNGSLGDQLGVKSDADPNAVGAISVSGTGIFLGNGTGTNIIGSIDGVMNGQNGQKLKINFSSNFDNPSFESGLTGWTVVTQQIKLGQTQLFGFTTPADPTYPSNTSNQDRNTPSATYSYLFSNTEKTQGNQSLRLYASMTTAAGCDVVHGGYAYSSPFQSNSGDVLSFDWRALGGSDAYDIFCYIVNVNTGASTIVLNQTGANTSAATPWAAASVTVPATGTYRFVFVSGTWDQTCGRAAGASLYIDNVKVFGNNVTPDIITSLARHVTYQNNCGTSAATRNLTVTLAKQDNTTTSVNSTIALTTYPPVAIAQNFTAALGSNGQVTVSPASVNNGSTDNCSMTFSLSKSSFTCADLGANPVVLTVTDTYGNTATANAVITVVDDTKPNIVCPVNITVNAPAGTCNASVTIPALAATDNCSAPAAISITNSFNHSANASGIYPLGTTTVTWTATDASGNTQSCTQTVTVLAPEIELTGNSVAIVNGSQTASAADNTDFGTVLTAAQVAKTFVVKNTGTIALTVNSIDINGANAGDFGISGITLPVSVAAGGTASFDIVFQSATPGTKNALVTVNNSDCDEAAYSFAVKAATNCTTPVFSNINPYLQAPTNAGGCSAVVTYPLSVSGTPAPNVSYTFSGATSGSGTGTGSGQTFNTGITHVKVTAVNGCGAPSSEFDVTVVDNVPPVVKTKNSTIYLDNTGQATLNAASLDDGSTDNCGTVTFLTNSSGIICATAAEGSYLTITAPAGKVISAIDFASYGTPTGSCGNFSIGGCHSSLSMSVLSQAIGQNSFTVAATNGVFGDPCGGTVKRLYVQASYTSTGATNVYDCSKLGNNSATLVVTDAAGNSASGTATVTVVDAIRPNVITRNLSICLDASGNATITPAQINNGSTDNCSIASYSLSQTNFTAANVGANTVTLTVTDGSGNSGTATAVVTVNGLPVVSADRTDVACIGGNTGSITVTATGGTAPYQYSTNGGSSFQSSNIFTGLTAGTYSIVVKTADGCVSAAQAVTVGTVVDVTRPTITAPAAISVNADAGYCGAAVSLGSPVTADNCAVQSVSNNSALFLVGGRYPVGVTTITWTVTDRSGNTNTATQTVTVTDAQVPVIVTPVAINVNNDAGTCGAEINITTPGATDNCGIANVQGIRNDGQPLNAVYPVGVTTIVWTATDVNGRSSTKNQTITVKDNERPAIVCAQPQSIDLDANCSAVLPDYSQLLAVNDNCTAANALTIVQSPAAGTAINGTGEMTVTFTVTDAAGNTNNCSITVTKKDVTAPVINCVDPITVSTDPDACGAVVTYAAPTATDGCNAASGSLSFAYTGAAVAWTVPAGVTSVNIRAYGAQGGNGHYTNYQRGGKGGYAAGTLSVTPGETLWINVGGQGVRTNVSPALGGFNGGGNGYNTGNTSWFVAGGGGATDIRRGGTALTNRVIVAGGGGGAGGSGSWGNGDGGDGGGLTGVDGHYSGLNGTPMGSPDIVRHGKGGTQTTGGAGGTYSGFSGGQPGALGIGGRSDMGNNTLSGGGGGGYYGGGGGSYHGGAGGGGSSYIGGVANGITNAGMQSGNGSLNISWSGVAVTVSQTTGLPSGSVFPVGTTTNTFVATDGSGNTSTCSFTVTVEDKQKPSVTASGNITKTADANDCGANINVPVPVTADNCGIASATNSYTHTPDASAHYPVGTTVVTWTVTDIHGNTQTTTQSVTVIDNENPVITNMPADIVINALDNNCSTLVGWTKPTASDNCAIASFVCDDPFFELYGVSLQSVGTHVITYTATDIHGNKTTAGFTVTVVDNQPPVITGCPGDITVNATAGRCDAVVNWNPPTASDNCPGVSLGTTHVQGSVFPVGTTTVTYTATDHVGNQTTCTFHVTVVDAENPTISIPNITVSNDAGVCGATVAIGTPVTNDNCGVASVVNTANANGFYPVGTSEISWTVTDIHGNAQTIVQTVTVNDTEKPVVITQPVTVQLGADGTASVNAAQVNNGSSDNCGIAGIALDKTSFSCAEVGDNTVTLTVRDVNGNVNSQTAVVTVIDNLAPVVIAKDITVNLDATGNVTITAADLNNGSHDACGIASLVISQSSFNCAHIGANTVTLTATDTHGNTSSRQATVTVRDITAPVVITKNMTIYLDAQGNASITAADINNGSQDACGIASITLSQTAFSCEHLGDNTVILTASDVNGNMATNTAIVTVKDSIAPVPTAAQLPVLTAECAVTVPVPTAADNCGGIINGTTNSPLVYQEQGTYTINWTYQDGSGNATSQTQTVVVKDVTKPVLTGTLPGFTNGQCIADVPAAPAAALIAGLYTDNCSDVTAVYNNTLTTGNNDTGWVVKYFYTISDANGNSLGACVTYSGKDNIAPVPTVASLPVLKGDCAVTVTAPAATDNCAGLITGTTSDPLEYNTQGTYVITWFYSDGNGNIATQLQTVIVKDETAPVPAVASLPVVTGQCAATVVGVPTASDACTGMITGTTNDPLSYTAQGTYTVRWKFSDIYGNTAYQDQTVIVKDDVVPVPVLASLPTVTAECSAGVVIRSTSSCNDDCRCCRNGCHCRTNNCRCRDYEYKHRGVISFIFNLLDYYLNWDDEDHECEHNSYDDEVLTPMSTPTATDNCAGTIVATTTDPLVYDTQGTYTIHWKYDDGNGNVTVQEQTIIVKDKTAPVANSHSLPTISGYCAVTVTNKPMAKDNCAGTITGTTSDPLTYNNPGTYTIHWVYDDGHGNTSTQNQTVVVKDPVPPVPAVWALPAITGNCAVTITTVPTAKDNCDGTLIGTTNDPLTYTKAGVYQIRWNYSDGKNVITQTQTVIVKDQVAPVPQVASLPTIYGSCSVVVTSIPKATDNCAGIIDAVTNSPLSYTAKGTYTIVWKYNDGNGNITTQNQTVVVTDAVAPVVVAPANTTVICGGSTAPAVTGAATATDNCSVASVTFTDNTNNNVITRTWKATDPSGNSATAVQKITITDNIAPVVTAPADISIGCGSSTHPYATGTATATDNCGTPALSYSDVKEGGSITRTWKATDAFGNVGTAVQLISFTDNVRPVVKCPGNVTLSCGASTLPNSCGGYATAKDNCDDNPVITYNDVTDGNRIIRTWKATDDAGNTGTCTQTITIVDNTRPVISDVADITIGCDASTLPATTGKATATDICDANVQVTYSDVTKDNVITRTWKATDASGNYSTSTQRITLGASFTPSITSVPAGNTYTGGVPTNLYIGYGAQSTTLQVCTLPWAGTPYSYTWSGNATGRLNSTSSAAPVFTPATAGSYTFVVTVTNKYGCSFASSITICVTDIRVPGTNGAKVYVCHTTGGKHGSSQTLQVSVNAVYGHISNNSCGGNGTDRLGSCDQAPCNSGSSAFSTQSKQPVTKEMTVTNTAKPVTIEEDLRITVMPNPSTSFFTLKLAGRNNTPVSLRVMDGTGRVIDARSKLDVHATLQIGHNYTSGTYYAEFIQGGVRKVVQLVKARG